MSNKFPLKLNNIAEGKTYAREAGGFVMLKRNQFFLAADDTLDFKPTTELTLADNFEITKLQAPDTLPELLATYFDDNRAEKRDQNFRKVLVKLVDEMEKLKVRVEALESSKATQPEKSSSAKTSSTGSKKKSKKKEK